VAWRHGRGGRADGPPRRGSDDQRAGGDAGDYAGRFVGPGGAVLTVAADGPALTLSEGDRRGRLRAIDDGGFVSDLAGRDFYTLDFGGVAGRRDRLWYGEMLFGRDGAPAQPASDPALAALAGTYLSNDPWIGESVVVARGDTLIVDGAGPVLRAPDGSWRFADPQSTERLWFDRPIGGRPQRLNVSGASQWRTAV